MVKCGSILSEEYAESMTELMRLTSPQPALPARPEGCKAIVKSAAWPTLSPLRIESTDQRNVGLEVSLLHGYQTICLRKDVAVSLSREVN